MSRCPFCKCDPFHYEHNGIGYVPVAVNCCDAGCGLYSGDKKAKQALRFMQSRSPKKKARAKQILEDHYS